MRVHLVGVCGTGMGQLALLLRDAGHDVSGSDNAFDAPMGPALEAAGIRCLRGFDAAHVEAAGGGSASGDPLDLVVVGNAIRKENPEAMRAEELALPRASMSATLREHFLLARRPLVVAGTHGKTTTSSMCAWILQQAGLEPGFFIGGLPKNFPSGAAIGTTKRKLMGGGARGAGVRGAAAKPAPFVVEGDEYDAVYWNKRPKFFDYVGIGTDDVVMITSIELDHIDIYPSVEVYEAQFEELAAMVPGDGVLVCDARDARTRRIVSEHAEAKTVFYGLQGDDTGSITPTWQGAIVLPDPLTGVQPFDLYAGGSFCGRFALEVPGAHNVRNAVGAIAACAEGFGIGVQTARTALASFHGVRRRQDLLGRPDEVAVYDDFAHHPTAVAETLRALRARHPNGKLWAVFEPRSATACRALHQHDYVAAFGVADRVLFAPLGRSNVPEPERLDLGRLAHEIGDDKAALAASVDAILDLIVRAVQPGDTVALLSNGAFGGIHARLLKALAESETDVNAGELERILGATRRAAHKAAELVRAGFRKHPVIEHKGAVELVTSYDRNSETLLREHLGALGFDIIGEEQGGMSHAGTPTFFVDPIDGTTNFVHGHPFWCVSVGLVVEAQPVLGVIVAPALGLEWYGYLAETGQRRAVRRAWGSAVTNLDAAPDAAAQEEPCSVSPRSRFEDSLLATGFPYDHATSSDNNFDAFVAIKQKCQAVRRCGSAALDLCLVADGTYEGYWERKLRPWDIAGGIALVRAAGGRVSELDGGDGCLRTGHLVATNGHIHDALLTHLASVPDVRGR